MTAFLSLLRQGAVFVLCLSLLSSKVQVVALEATWTKSSESEPLPQSAKYRANLRKLCAVLASGGRLSPGTDTAALEKTCAKLQRDDDNVSQASLSSRAGRGAALALGVAGAFFAWQSYGGHLVRLARQTYCRFLGRDESTRAVKRMRGGETDDLVSRLVGTGAVGLARGFDGAEGAELLEMRLARLRRFEAGAGSMHLRECEGAAPIHSHIPGPDQEQQQQ